METKRLELSLALVHHPVVNKCGDVVTSSVTTMDAHDMARLCRTYGACALYIITPLKAQQRLVGRVIEHWTVGFGGEYNPHRKQALGLVKVVDSVDSMMDNLQSPLCGAPDVAVVATSAKDCRSAVSFAEARALLGEKKKAVLLFGTAHGLCDSVIDRADIRLKPVSGRGDYNHLPVRLAAAIIMDRLFGRDNLER